jgi:ribosome biogenesis GTPase A
MHKAQKEMRETLPNVDVIIEVLDARIPFSSENPMLAQIRGDKPCIKVLSKSDLADPETTKMWQDYLEREKNVKALAITTDDPSLAKQIPGLCRKLAPAKEQSVKDIHTMIVGIPNVGKSTLINLLAGRIIAKTGNEPAVTKRQQRIKLEDGILLSDTPGVLWPKVENPQSGYRLAVTGAIKDTAMEYEDVATFAAKYLLEAYPEQLIERYKLAHLPGSELEALEAIGAKRGCLRSGGRIDYHKASEALLHDYRAGTIGRITLETPPMVEQELIELAIMLEQQAAEKAAKKEARQKRRSKR